MIGSKPKAKDCNHGQLVSFFYVLFLFSTLFYLFVYFFFEKLAIQLLLKIGGEIKVIYVCMLTL